MAQEIKQGSLFGRIGSGIGKGLAEQLPEEITRGRLSAGLKNLSEKKDLTPFQQFAGLISQPGMTPQGIQTGGDILRQQNYINAIKNQYDEGGPKSGKNKYQPTQEEFKQPLKGEIPTLSTPEATAESYKDYIPPTAQEERSDAAENFNKNPARYDYNFDKALEERQSFTKRAQEIQQAYQSTEQRATGKEEKVKSAFDKEVERLGIDTTGEKPTFDPKLKQIFESKAINSILSKKDGGEGLSQEQAIKKYSDELLKSYQNYRDLSSLSIASPTDFNRGVDAVVKNFEQFGQAGKNVIFNKLISDYKLSPLYSAHKTYPIKKGSLPTLDKLEYGSKGFGVSGLHAPKMNDNTYEKLKNEMGKTKSPLSIAYELEQKGHSPRGFLNYLNRNRDNLEVWQADQLGKNINIFDIRDIWLRNFEGK